jgi:hypothetical protein
VPGYAAIPATQQILDVEYQLRTIIDALATHQSPGPEVVARARAIGIRRAELGLPLPDVVEAYHIGYAKIWNELQRRAKIAGSPSTEELLAEVAFVWQWFHALTSTVAQAHFEETTARSTARAALMRRLLGLLRRRPIETSAGANLLKELGLDAGKDVVLAYGHGIAESEIAKIADAVTTQDQPVRGAPDGGNTVFIAQGYVPEDLVPALRRAGAGPGLGVGLARRGVAGAALSLLDAEDALRRALAIGEVVSFGDEWHLCALEPARERLTPLLARAVEVAELHPQLAATVRAFADCSFSISACSRRLHVHANSAKYRLDRWHSLTGWDPLTYEGLLRSMIALDPVRDGDRDRFAPGTTVRNDRQSPSTHK